MRIFHAVVASFCLLSASAFADDKAVCEANKGTYLVGTVMQDPVYQPESRNHGVLKGIKLSHTKLFIKPDGDNQTWEVNIDNVFAADYVANQAVVPPSLAALRARTRVSVCGETYNNDGRVGIHWVHNNCGKTPSPQKPNGWIRALDASGHAGANLEGSEQYCYLWGRR